MTVVELVYVGLVTALGRRQGWSVATGVIHPSAEEQAEGPPPTSETPLTAPGILQGVESGATAKAGSEVVAQPSPDLAPRARRFHRAGVAQLAQLAANVVGTDIG